MDEKEDLLKQKKEIEARLTALEELNNETKVFVNGWDVTEYEKWYDEKYCLEVVQQDGSALAYVKVQTPEICLAAVQQYGVALRYVKDQTEEFCLAAVQQDGTALRYVKVQTPELCLAAVQQYGSALEYVDKRVFDKKKEAKK